MHIVSYQTMKCTLVYSAMGLELWSYIMPHMKFIAARVPWWGGFWERIIQLVKRSLRKVIGKTTLTFDTLLIEIEAIINNQPPTFAYDDSGGISYVLTPSHLLYGHR